MIAGGMVHRLLDKLAPGLALDVGRTASAEFLDYQETRPEADWGTFVDAFQQGAYMYISAEGDDEPEHDLVPDPRDLHGAHA